MKVTVKTGPHPMNNALPLPNDPRDWVEDLKDEENGCYRHLCRSCLVGFWGAKARRFIRMCKLCDTREQLYTKEAFEEMERDDQTRLAMGMPIPDEANREAFVSGYVRAAMTARSKDPEGERAALAWMRAQAKSLDPTIDLETLNTSDLGRIICEKTHIPDHPETPM